VSHFHFPLTDLALKFTDGRCLSVTTLVLAMACSSIQGAPRFERNGDIGNPSRPGSVVRETDDAWIVAGGGENMWFTNDAFHFTYTPITGDFRLSAAVAWLQTGGNPHRKAALIIRESVAPDAAYIDVAVHGDGLTSLQFRDIAGGPTREIQFAQANPGKVAIQRMGDVFFACSEINGAWVPSGAFFRMKLPTQVLVGLGVCAHDDQVLEKARFTSIALNPEPLALRNAGRSDQVAATTNLFLHSTLETVAIGSKDRRILYHTQDRIEAPNWSPDGTFLLFNSKGRILRLAAQGGPPETVETGFAIKCNNDHGISPDGKHLVISDQTKTGKSLIYTLPITGGEPKLITMLGPSYWHGWSPDGKTLAYCAERNGQFDIYTIPAAGGEERRLTDAKGLDDGPDYSPDGQFIYFNSERSGRMQIWRIRTDGTEPTQITHDERNNWFPHPSPDGKWIVYLSYEPSISGHPENQAVRLCLLPTTGGPVQELARLFGGQGTINVPSWSPDSRHVAFVSYEQLP
jgi:hypothetical protein